MNMPMHNALASSRLLKKSFAFADEARIIAVVDIEVANETACSTEHDPSAPARWVVVVGAFPGEFGTGRPVARAIADIQEALKRAESDLAVRFARKCEMRLFDEIEKVVVPNIHLDDAPAAGKRLGKGWYLGHQLLSASNLGRRTKL